MIRTIRQIQIKVHSINKWLVHSKNIKIMKDKEKLMDTPDWKTLRATIREYNFWSQIFFPIKDIISKIGVLNKTCRWANSTIPLLNFLIFIFVPKENVFAFSKWPLEYLRVKGNNICHLLSNGLEKEVNTDIDKDTERKNNKANVTKC